MVNRTCMHGHMIINYLTPCDLDFEMVGIIDRKRRASCHLLLLAVTIRDDETEK